MDFFLHILVMLLASSLRLFDHLPEYLYISRETKMNGIFKLFLNDKNAT